VPQPPGSLLIIDRNGNLVETLTDAQLLDGPWDLAVHDEGGRAQVFVSNVLNGTVTRIDLTIPGHGAPVVQSMTRIASGYAFHADPAAVVVGPTGLAYDARKDILYVASTADNAIFAIDDARDREGDTGTGRLVYRDDVHLHGPLGLALAPNGDLITANGDAPTVNPPGPGQQNKLVEFTPSGQFIGQFMLDPGGPGAAFGLAVTSSHGEIRLAAVNDNTNMLEDWDIATS
jgi:sugar lactone lactonase YvrE